MTKAIRGSAGFRDIQQEDADYVLEELGGGSPGGSRTWEDLRDVHCAPNRSCVLGPATVEGLVNSIDEWAAESDPVLRLGLRELWLHNLRQAISPTPTMQPPSTS